MESSAIESILRAMSSPAMTWKVRRIGHGLWSSVCASNRTAWSWIARVQRTAQPSNAEDDSRRQASSISPPASDDAHLIGDAHQWLTALRLDRAAAALAESD
jgi:hypothetical protein